MQSLVTSIRDTVKAQSIEEAKTQKGLKAFADDESMLDDLQNDLQVIGLLVNKHWTWDLKKGTITFTKVVPKLNNVLRQYHLK